MANTLPLILANGTLTLFAADLFTLNYAPMTGYLTNYVRKMVDTLNGFDMGRPC